ncbi:hypothetical protein D3C78_1124510 [compost metagenome]
MVPAARAVGVELTLEAVVVVAGEFVIQLRGVVRKNLERPIRIVDVDPGVTEGGLRSGL